MSATDNSTDRPTDVSREHRPIKDDPFVILACLAEWFPRAFTLEQYLPHRPLNIAIDRDTLERSSALDRRVDLNGDPAGEVTLTEAEHAVARLAEILDRAQGRACRSRGGHARREEARPRVAAAIDIEACIGVEVIDSETCIAGNIDTCAAAAASAGFRRRRRDHDPAQCRSGGAPRRAACRSETGR